MPRRTSWEDMIADSSITSGSFRNLDMLPNLTADETRGTTVTRIIGSINLFSGTVAGAWGKQIVDIGIGVISEDAFNAGAVPDVNQQSDQPQRGWLYRTRMMVEQNGTGSQIVYPVRFDVRAQRRIDAGTMFLGFTSAAGTGTSFTVEMAVLTRSLLILP